MTDNIMSEQIDKISEQNKKQIPLRLSPSLLREISAWAEEDFRSVNRQIEYLLTECVRQRRKSGRPVPKKFEGDSKE